MSSRSSAVMSVAPRAALTKNGAPPTERKARTGEFTPPGMSWRARAKRASEDCVMRDLSSEVYSREVPKMVAATG
jgi:hypothetical protein